MANVQEIVTLQRTAFNKLLTRGTMGFRSRPPQNFIFEKLSFLTDKQTNKRDEKRDLPRADNEVHVSFV